MADNLTLAKLAERLNQLEQKYSLLEAERDFLRSILRTFGIEGHWLSPAKAAILIGSSRDRIMSDIETAELLRMQGKKSDLEYGVHYRNDRATTSDQPTWKVNILEYPKVFKIPPEQRRVG